MPCMLAFSCSANPCTRPAAVFYGSVCIDSRLDRKERTSASRTLFRQNVFRFGKFGRRVHWRCISRERSACTFARRSRPSAICGVFFASLNSKPPWSWLFSWPPKTFSLPSWYTLPAQVASGVVLGVAFATLVVVLPVRRLLILLAALPFVISLTLLLIRKCFAKRFTKSEEAVVTESKPTADFTEFIEEKMEETVRSAASVFAAAVETVAEVSSKKSVTENKTESSSEDTSSSASAAGEERTETKQSTKDHVLQTLKNLKIVISELESGPEKRKAMKSLAKTEEKFGSRTVRVAIFGTDQSGKSLLLNKLLNFWSSSEEGTGGAKSVVSRSNDGSSFSVELENGMNLCLVDTPGSHSIGGMTGRKREFEGRILAAESEAVLFVCDRSLSDHEKRGLRGLTGSYICKRTLLIVNKRDTHLNGEEGSSSCSLGILLDDLVKDVKGLSGVKGNEILCISALYPQDIRLVIERLIALVQSEGEDLVAANVALQCYRIEKAVVPLLKAQRRKKAEAVVEKFQWIQAGLIVAAPVALDLIASGAVSVGMIVAIGQEYGVEMTNERAADLAQSLVGAMSRLKIDTQSTQALLTGLSLLGLVTFGGSSFVLGKVFQAMSAAYLSRVAGFALIEYFDNDQSWGEGSMDDVLKRMMDALIQDQFVKDFVGQAWERILFLLPVSERPTSLPPRRKR